MDISLVRRPGQPFSCIIYFRININYKTKHKSNIKKIYKIINIKKLMEHI